MIFFPAIDLKEGRCVRLQRGEMDKATVFNDDPVAQARIFESEGAQWLHLVDLNGACDGQSVNGNDVVRLLESLSIPVQLGGGIRSLDAIDFWFAQGVARVILGTAALENPQLVKKACQKYPGKIAVGVDTKNGFVASNGWLKVSQISAFELVEMFEDTGVSALVHTDIDCDGVMSGPNIQATLDLAKKTSIPVIASGGVSSLQDLKTLYAVGHDLLEGVICGRAIYDGKIMVSEAVSLLQTGYVGETKTC